MKNNFFYLYLGWMTIVSLVPTITKTKNAIQIVVNAETAGVIDLSCDLNNDPCPFRLQEDGICHSEYGVNVEACRGGDCFDCDECANFSFDCNSCLEHGCFWCGESAICTNSDQYIFSRAYGCQQASDFSQSSCNPPGSIFSDPFFSTQSWVFEQINVLSVWEQGLRGKGIRVRINDDAFDATNPEFSGRFDEAASCDGTVGGRSYIPQDSGDTHGTSVASVVGAAANNNFCAVGIAPEVTFSACHALRRPSSVIGYKVDSMDISVNSYGEDACKLERRLQESERRTQQQECPFVYGRGTSFHPCDYCDFTSTAGPSVTCENSITFHCSSNFENDIVGCIEFLDLFIVGGRCEFNSLTQADQEAFATGIRDGRDGKGIIYVWASGNTYDAGEDTNFQGYLNTRLTIAVGATGRDGFHSSFSTAGAALFVSAPGGDMEDYIEMIGATLNGGCEQIGAGTSLACPVVSGVVALMLEANSELGWRDVQGILATTSRMVENDPLDTSLVTNGAGIKHSNFYGFGIVDASAAVEAAKTWELYGPEEMIMVESGDLELTIADDGTTPVVSTVSVAESSNGVFVVESVVVYLNIQHFSRGDLDVVLTSPAGTESVLSPGNRPESTQLDKDENWKLLTVRSWGETAAGDWTLSVLDISKGDSATCSDIPWEGIFFDSEGQFSLSCYAASRLNYCMDGQPAENAPYEYLHKQDISTGLTPLLACCECGGGYDTNSFTDRFIQWRLVVYGRTLNSAPTIMPAISPSPGNSPSGPTTGGAGQPTSNNNSGGTPTGDNNNNGNNNNGNGGMMPNGDDTVEPSGTDGDNSSMIIGTMKLCSIMTLTFSISLMFL